MTCFRFAFFLPIVALFAQESGVTPTVCPSPLKSIADCPARGCGSVSDAFLNLAKNRTDMPPAGALQKMTVAQVKKIPQPTKWKTGQNRDSIFGSGREGTPVQLVGFLKFAKAEHGESCNCELDTPTDTDVHLVLVTKLTDAEKTSVTCEITPRVRAAGHSNWTADKVKALEGKFVRLTGWLMLDSAHLPHPVLLDGEHARGPLKRATNWEVHPILKLEVCKSTAQQCNAGQGFEEF